MAWMKRSECFLSLKFKVMISGTSTWVPVGAGWSQGERIGHGHQPRRVESPRPHDAAARVSNATIALEQGAIVGGGLDRARRPSKGAVTISADPPAQGGRGRGGRLGRAGGALTLLRGSSAPRKSDR